MSEPQSTEFVSQATQTVEATGGLGMLGINLKIFIAQLINFVIVLFVLWKWAYTPLVRLLDQRSERIEKSMKQADEIEKRIKKVAEDQKRIVNQAKTEAAIILDQARADADRRKKELLEGAKAEVQRVVTQGKEQLRIEKADMLRDAKSEIVDLALAAATKVLKESITEKTSHKLAEEVVEKML
jgi:F-type H+-transporting ATPase subunit b